MRLGSRVECVAGGVEEKHVGRRMMMVVVLGIRVGYVVWVHEVECLKPICGGMEFWSPMKVCPHGFEIKDNRGFLEGYEFIGPYLNALNLIIDAVSD